MQLVLNKRTLRHFTFFNLSSLTMQFVILEITFIYSSTVNNPYSFALD